MATGDTNDIQIRLRRYLPPWFGTLGDYPLVDSILGGFATALSSLFSLIAFTRLQARIATSTGAWLDLTAWSFLGDELPRFHLEGDDSYRDRVRREIFRDRNTRPSAVQLLTELTGVPPAVFEGWYAPSNGGYGTPGLAYGAAGVYGSRGAPSQVIFTAQIPQTYGIPNRLGYGSLVSGYGSGDFSYVDDSLSTGHGASITDILNRLESIRTDGIEYWVKFTEPPGF